MGLFVGDICGVVLVWFGCSWGFCSQSNKEPEKCHVTCMSN